MDKKAEVAIENALEQLDRVGFDALDEKDKVLTTLWALEAEVNNGGFDQFFYNSAGDLAFFAPEALKKIGAATMAQIAERANSIFGETGPPRNTEKRREILLFFEDKYEEFFNEIDLKFYDYPDDLGSLIESYVENNS